MQSPASPTLGTDIVPRQEISIILAKSFKLSFLEQDELLLSITANIMGNCGRKSKILGVSLDLFPKICSDSKSEQANMKQIMDLCSFAPIAMSIARQ